MKARYPRLIVAGAKGDSGKTIVTLSLLLALRQRGVAPVAFKKGPDFIDAAWLGWAAGSEGRNLDTYIMGVDRVRQSFFGNASLDQVNLVEGNRGLHDGSDPQGTHSTAELAKLLQAPTVLVLPVTKTTRTAAAMVLGCKMLDPDLNLAGVILNQYAGPRHKKVVTESIETLTGVPVLGAIPTLSVELIPNRHLGLCTLAEYDRIEAVQSELLNIADKYLDVDRIIQIANQAEAVEPGMGMFDGKTTDGADLNIGVVCDEAFSFYYPENLEALEKSGATIRKISAVGGDELPADLDALIIGGGFPEMNLDKICANRKLMEQIRSAAESGLPIYAECGGLMYLAQSIEYKGAVYPLCGVFPLTLSVSEKPKGHGYCEVLVENDNPFFEKGTMMRGHEFHYSHIVSGRAPTAFSVTRGTGCFDKKDGLVYKNVLANYLHLHVGGSPEWIGAICSIAKRYKAKRQIAHQTDCKQASGQG